jgi:hypothetical protein
MRHLRNRLLRAAAVVVALAFAGMVTGAQASTIHTINFEATNLAIISGDPFGAAGFGMSPQGTVTGSFSFDTAVAPIVQSSNPGATNPRGWDATYFYTSFTVQLGNTTLTGALSNPAAGLNEADRIMVRDGGSIDDYFTVVSDTNVATSLTSGAILNLMRIDLFAPNITYSGTAFPSIDTLNSMNLFTQLYIELYDQGGSWLGNAQYHDLTFTAPVPLPAAFPLFGTGLGILGFLGWRRRRKAQVV